MSNKIKIFVTFGIMVADIAYSSPYIAGIPSPYSITTAQKDNKRREASFLQLDTVYSFSTPGTWPDGLAWDGQYLWLSDADSLKIWKLDTLGTVISSFPSPAGATSSGELAYDGSYLWFVAEQDGKLFKLNPVNCSTVAVFNVPDSNLSDPNTFGVTWDGTYLWVSKYYTNRKIYKFQPSNETYVDSFTPPTDYILPIEYLYGYIYGVDCWGEKIYKMDPNTGAVVDSSSWPLPYALGITWDGTCWWGISSAISVGGNQRVYKLCGWPFGVEENPKSQFPTPNPRLEMLPNPLTALTEIKYELPEPAYTKGTFSVKIELYNLAGRKIATLAEGEQSAGMQVCRLPKSTLVKGNGISSSGIYFIKFNAGKYEEIKKVVLMK